MFKHILVPVDGSETSLQAVSKAAELAKVFNSEVTAVYVLDPYPFTGVGADFAYGQAQYLSAATAEANKALEDVTERMKDTGVTVKTLVGEGHAIHEGIVRVGENVGADLIVMGSHGRRGLEKLVLGSVAQRVLQTAKVPVLVVRGYAASAIHKTTLLSGSVFYCPRRANKASPTRLAVCSIWMLSGASSRKPPGLPVRRR